jgi:hypothetical protein
MSTEEHKAYQRGYVAGRKRQKADADQAAIKAGEREFWEKAVLAVAPYFMGCPAWKRGDKELRTLEDRTELAVKFADAAVRARRSR